MTAKDIIETCEAFESDLEMAPVGALEEENERLKQAIHKVCDELTSKEVTLAQVTLSGKEIFERAKVADAAAKEYIANLEQEAPLEAMHTAIERAEEAEGELADANELSDNRYTEILRLNHVIQYEYRAEISRLTERAEEAEKRCVLLSEDIFDLRAAACWY